MKPCHGSAMCFKCGCHVSQILTPEVAVLKGWHCPCAIDSPSHPISYHCTPGVHLQCWWSIWLCTPVCDSSPSTDVTPLIESLPWFQPKNQNPKHCPWRCNDDAMMCDVVSMKLILLLDISPCYNATYMHWKIGVTVRQCVGCISILVSFDHLHSVLEELNSGAHST